MSSYDEMPKPRWYDTAAAPWLTVGVLLLAGVSLVRIIWLGIREVFF